MCVVRSITLRLIQCCENYMYHLKNNMNYLLLVRRQYLPGRYSLQYSAINIVDGCADNKKLTYKWPATISLWLITNNERHDGGAIDYNSIVNTRLLCEGGVEFPHCMRLLRTMSQIKP